MTKKLQHIFALSEKGAKDLVKAVFWCFVCNLALMFPIGAVLVTIQHLLGCLEGGGSPTDGFWLYVGFALAVLLLLFVLHWFQYASLYIATYRESANRRVSLAETLRRLPLSFFGNRDLSDLTATMIADCSSLDQMFSHYVPQLFASVGSTLVIGVCMFACDWRMALAVLWVVPVAVALTAGSKKIQDAFGTKNILNKRAVADCIQEGLETIRDIKACHRQERYLGDLEAKLSAMEGSSIRSELATGVFVCSAQAFLRLGLATTVLTGGALLLAGELSFLYFLGFLWPGSSPSSISWASCSPLPGCMILWGWYSRISPPPSTPSCKLNGCALFWNSRCRQEQRTSTPTDTTSPLTMSPLPTGREQGCWKM